MASSSDEQATPPPPKKQWTLPPILNHFNPHDLKTVFRCWVAVWVCMLLIFIQPALQDLGLATFFAALVLMIVPPANVLSAYLLAGLTLLLGMCMGWAWGLVTMKAALAVRSDAETQQILAQLGEAAVARAKQTGEDPASAAQILLHDGFTLDARITTVYFVMGLVFIYGLARLRFKNHKFVPMQLFGTIVTDLFMLIGPTLPSFTASLGQILVEPGAVGISVGMACSLLIFPHSTSYAVLSSMEKVILRCETALAATRKGLAGQELSIGELVGAKGAQLGLYKAILPLLAFLPLDFSRGRWNAEDVQALHAPVRETMAASLSLLDFHVSRIGTTQREAELEEHHEKGGKGIGVHQMDESAALIHAMRAPENARIVEDTREAIKETMAGMLDVCSESVALAAKCINTVNTRRWINQPKQSEFDELARELDDHIVQMQTTRESCIKNTTERVLETHADLFDASGNLTLAETSGPRLIRGIVLSMVIEERIIGVSLGLEKLQQALLDLVNTRKVHRIWAPQRLRYAVSWLFDPTVSVAFAGPTDIPDEDPDNDSSGTTKEEKEESETVYIGPRRRGAFVRALTAALAWFGGPAGTYALRMVIVTFATTIPAVIPYSAGFFYREKGLWAVITAQTCMLVYMADFSMSLLCRGLGTVLGGTLGMVAWYVGSGSGPGNPYGLGASCAVFLLVVVWIRLFLPPRYMYASLMGGVTFVLVVGFSYDMHHIDQYGLPGLGWEAFWKRVVTVLLGFVASSVVQMLPKPPSATKHVCKSLANVLTTLSDHYALLLSGWGSDAGLHPEHGTSTAEKISLSVAETLTSLDGSISLLGIEITLGPFDAASLRDVQRLCMIINQTLGRLLALSSTLPANQQDRFALTSGFLDERVMGDIMSILGIVSLSLKTATPLPERLPVPMLRSFYDAWNVNRGGSQLTRDLVRQDSYRRYCVALFVYLKFLAAVDDLVLVVKRAVGERHVVRRRTHAA